MHRITLEQIFKHHITQKYVNRSGMVHAIAVAYHAFHLAKKAPRLSRCCDKSRFPS